MFFSSDFCRSPGSLFALSRDKELKPAKFLKKDVCFSILKQKLLPFLYTPPEVSCSPIRIGKGYSIFALSRPTLRLVFGRVLIYSYSAFFRSKEYLGRFLHHQGFLTLCFWATPLSWSQTVRRAHHTLSGSWTKDAVQIPSIGVSDQDTLAWGQLTLGLQHFFVFTKGVLPGKGFQRSLFGSCVLSKQLDRGIWADFTLWHDAKKKVKKSYLRLALEGPAYKSYAISDMKPPHPPHSSCASGLFG